MVLQNSMREDEIPKEESEAKKGIRAWRATERKTMVESMEKLLAQAQRLALSKYTRSAERSKWTRLAGQLLWYKDQILRAMTWEAIEQDFNRLERDVYKDRNRRQAPTWQRITPAPFVPNLVKKRKDDPDAEEDSGDTVPEIMREEDSGVDNASSDAGSDKDHDVDGSSNDPDPSKISSHTDPEISKAGQPLQHTMQFSSLSWKRCQVAVFNHEF